jgi:FO synthase
VHAVARLLLHGRIDHVQTSWVKLGVTGSRAVLLGGADDLGGTLMEETISRMAGSQNGSLKTIAELEDLAAGIGRPAVQRTTEYGRPSAERLATARSDAGRRALTLSLTPVAR